MSGDLSDFTASMTEEAKLRRAEESSSDVLVSQWARERPDVDMQNFGILLRIRALGMLMDQKAAVVSKQLGLKGPELYLLYALRRGGEPYRLRPTDIYKLLRVTSGTITYRIDNLEQVGLVTRVPDPADRRSVVIQLTERGRETVDRAVDATFSLLGEPLKTLFRDAKEAAAFTDVLKRLGLLYDQMMDDADNPLVHDADTADEEAMPSKRRSSAPAARTTRAVKTPAAKVRAPKTR